MNAAPTSVVPTKKSTFVTVAGVTAVAFAVTKKAAPKVTPAVEVGAESATVGAVTMTFAIADVTVVPFESVTRAVSAVTPATVGVHVVANGAVCRIRRIAVGARHGADATRSVGCGAVAGVVGR